MGYLARDFAETGSLQLSERHAASNGLQFFRSLPEVNTASVHTALATYCLLLERGKKILMIAQNNVGNRIHLGKSQLLSVCSFHVRWYIYKHDITLWTLTSTPYSCCHLRFLSDRAESS